VFLAIEYGRIGSSEPNIRYELASSAKDAASHDPTQISAQALAFWSAVHIQPTSEHEHSVIVLAKHFSQGWV
jgi:hypothetical protein